MKNPLILSLNSVHPFIHERSCDDILKLTGNNIGNLLFSSAVQRIVKGGKRQNQFSFNPTAAEEAGHDGLVIAAANWLQPKNDFSGLAKQIERSGMSAVITGLGAQSIDEKIPELQSGMIRFLEVVSERSAALSVRGDFTAEVLNHYGIRNVEVTGCPSLLWHMQHAPKIRHKPSTDRPLKISLNGTIPGKTVPRREDRRMKFARFLMQEALRHDLDFVLQTEVPLLRAFQGTAGEKDLEYLDYLFKQGTRPEYSDWIASHVKFFGLVGEWISYCANQDVVVGTRLHGVIAGLLSGTPSILITHDARTREMAKTASIPNISSDWLLSQGELAIDAVISEVDFDAFNEGQIRYYERFKEFWEKNEVPNNLA